MKSEVVCKGCPIYQGRICSDKFRHNNYRFNPKVGIEWRHVNDSDDSHFWNSVTYCKLECHYELEHMMKEQEMQKSH